MVEYDSYYQQENYFGAPLKALLEFYKNQPEKGKLLDLGCGQGRNAIPLAKLGYDVLGVDISKVGINQMIDFARRNNLSLRGIVSDIFSFDLYQEYDFILLDSMLHFKKDDIEKEIGLLLKIADRIKFGSMICLCIWESEKNQNIVLDFFNSHKDEWRISVQNEIDYLFPDTPKQKFEYTMIVLEKLSV